MALQEGYVVKAGRYLAEIENAIMRLGVESIDRAHLETSVPIAPKR